MICFQSEQTKIELIYIKSKEFRYNIYNFNNKKDNKWAFQKLC